jgi:tyrosine-protein phosphatase OCA1
MWNSASSDADEIRCNKPGKLIVTSMTFIQDQDINFHHLGVVATASAWDPITEEVVLEALDLILRPEHHPMIIMCNLGRHRTGNYDCIRMVYSFYLIVI